MISKQDILDRAGEWRLLPRVVEKDYVLGWLLAAFAEDAECNKAWVFKGGTCLKKCYLETYRFSEDLDFTLLPTAAYSAEELTKIVQRIARRASEMIGIEFPLEQITVQEFKDRLRRPTFFGKIAYRGPMGDRGSLPRVVLDITRHEKVVDKSAHRYIFHPYPDALPSGLKVSAYSLEEVLAEKTRALYDRTRPRDLYDVVHILENYSAAIDLNKVLTIFQEKCQAKSFPIPTASELLDIVQKSEELRSEWQNMLGHQLPYLPDIDAMIADLPKLIAWVDKPTAPLKKRASLPTKKGERLVAPPSIQYWGGQSAIELIRFAGTNRMVIEFMYHGTKRRAEPYSFRQPATGNLLLYAWEIGSHIKAFKVDEISDLQVAADHFSPRYTVELTSVV